MRADFARAAASYDEAAVLARETGARMAQRLDYIKLAPSRMADIGCATGDGIRELQGRYPKAWPLAVDFALPMLRATASHSTPWQNFRGRAPRLLNADVRALPLQDRSLDLIWSNLMLHWLDEPLPAFQEIHRVLDVGGLLMFSALGPDTLKELRRGCRKLGADEAAPRFHDMHDLGDRLLGAGFADPVMDMETIRFSYRSLRRFLADQRQLGVRNALLGYQPWRIWRQLFAAWEREGEGFPVTFEIVYGHAWKAAPQTAADGRAILQFHPRAGRS